MLFVKSIVYIYLFRQMRFYTDISSASACERKVEKDVASRIMTVHNEISIFSNLLYTAVFSIRSSNVTQLMIKNEGKCSLKAP